MIELRGSAGLPDNEDFSVIVSGFTGLNTSIVAAPAGTPWALPSELDLFSVDQYCGFHSIHSHCRHCPS